MNARMSLWWKKGENWEQFQHWRNIYQWFNNLIESLWFAFFHMKEHPVTDFTFSLPVSLFLSLSASVCMCVCFFNFVVEIKWFLFSTVKGWKNIRFDKFNSLIRYKMVRCIQRSFFFYFLSPILSISLTLSLSLCLHPISPYSTSCFSSSEHVKVNKKKMGQNCVCVRTLPPFNPWKDRWITCC